MGAVISRQRGKKVHITRKPACMISIAAAAHALKCEPQFEASAGACDAVPCLLEDLQLLLVIGLPRRLGPPAKSNTSTGQHSEAVLPEPTSNPPHQPGRVHHEK